MRCPNCGADVNSAFCGYCGTRMPLERVETRSIHAGTVVVNNYYSQQQSNGPFYQQQPPSPVGAYAYAYAAGAQSFVSPKSRTAALLLCLFFGVFGAHRFYLRRYLLGVVFFLTLGLCGIGWLADLVFILLGKIKDGDHLPVKNW